jgi:hypothetical protein
MMIDRPAVSAMASGSQHNTMRAMSHRIARSESVSTPSNSATYRMGAVSVPVRRAVLNRSLTMGS